MDLGRYQHAARELERFARLRLYEATAEQDVAEARTLLRLTVGVRRKLERWAVPVPPKTADHSRRRAPARPGSAGASVASRHSTRG